MRKRLRPTFFEHLDGHYSPQPAGREVGGRALGKRPREKRKGVIDMSITQFVALAVFFILLACAATAGSAYAVIAVAGDGPRGEQGITGPQGDPGPQGERGVQGPNGNDASQEMIKRLAGLFAVQQASAVAGGAFVTFNDEQVGSCVQYVLTGKPGVDACPGFSTR
jgi:hypothetical protein